MKCSAFDWIVMILVIIGAINWGLIGLFDYNFVQSIFGHSFSRFIFIIVGLAGLWMIFFAVKCGRCCKSSGSM